MRDERNSLNKKSDAQISADDLLARLKQSFDDADKTKNERPDSTAKQYDKSLMIDDDVYREAEERVHTSEAVTAPDDSDLDIDELIEMYITKPKAEREARAAEENLPPVDENGDNIVHELTAEEMLSDESGDEALPELGLDETEAVDVFDGIELPLDLDKIESLGEIDDILSLDTAQIEAVLAQDAVGEAGADSFDGKADMSVEDVLKELELDEEWIEQDSIEDVEFEDEWTENDSDDLEISEEIAEPGAMGELKLYDELAEPDAVDELELDEEWTEPDAIEELQIVDGVSGEVVDETLAEDEPECDAPIYADAEEEIDAEYTYDDADVKVAEPVTENAVIAAEFEEREFNDDTTTAVFDISQVKQLADEGDDELDRVIDEAFNKSATEVFTPVGDAELADDISQQDDTRIYGQADGEEIDQTDLHLMLAFGMDDQLKETVGAEQASKIEDDIIQKHEETAQINAVAQQLEYVTPEQNDEIMSDYESKYKSLLVRMAGAVALLLCTFFIENFSLLGLSLPEFMKPTSYPIVYAMIDLQLVVLSGVLVYKQIIDGCLAVWERKTVPQAITSAMLILSVIYTFVAAFTAPMEKFALYNLPVVLCVLLALLYEFMNLKREVYSFNVVSSKNKKFVITPVSDATKSLEREVFSDYVSNDAQIIRVGKTDFVDGFFERISGSKPSKPIIGIMLSVVGVAAVVFAVLAAFTGQGVYGAFTMAFLTVTLSAPLALLFVFAYPFYKASKDAFASESAIIGERSLGEYSSSAVISFEDKEVFPSRGVKVTSIKVFGQNRIDEIIYNVASSFIKVGGPLADVFSQATHDMGYSEDVELVEVDNDGFTVTVDDELVYIGKASYMEKKDYDPPYDSEGRKQEQISSVGVLFIAFRGQLAAKIYVTYTIDREFEKILNQLYKTGMCVGIKSFDPNIDDLLLSKKIRAIKYPVKVIRAKNVEDIPHTFERCESGVVSRRSVKALLRTVALCERVSSVVKTDIAVGILSMIIGAVVMIFIHAFGLSGSFPSLYALLYQLFWLIPVAVISKLLV